MRDTLTMQDPSGADLFKVQKKTLHVRDTMNIERDGDTAATVKKALIHAALGASSSAAERLRVSCLLSA
jgi:uncharacterized protein YxjI